MVPEDRKNNGVFMKLSVLDNILVSALEKCLKKAFISSELEQLCVEEYTQKLSIKYSGKNSPCQNLSGGNQQKVVIARALNADPEIIILDEPTRGIDVMTKSEIHRLMSELAVSGKAIILVSSELPEIMGMSDRIVVLHEGIQTGILLREEATADKIMSLAVSNREMEIEVS